MKDYRRPINYTPPAVASLVQAHGHMRWEDFVDVIERAYLTGLYQACGYNMSLTAFKAGLNRQGIIKRFKRWGVATPNKSDLTED